MNTDRSSLKQKNMTVSMKVAFNILDKRLSTSMDDVYEMLNYIFDEDFMTHHLPKAMKRLEEKNPRWFSEAKLRLDGIKSQHGNDFKTLMGVLSKSTETVTLEKVTAPKMHLTDGLPATAVMMEPCYSVEELVVEVYELL